jgi:hypothetical protein
VAFFDAEDASREEMEPRMRWAYQTRLFVCAVLLTGSVVGNVCSAQEGVPAVKYFLDEKPDNADVSRLPASARQPLIAKVRVVSITSSTSRDGGSPTNGQFLAELRLLELYSGDAPATQEMFLSFAPVGAHLHIKYPHTPSMREREYFIVSYVGEDRRRCLLGYPISQDEYKQFDAERRRYERSR